jgi:hypothetical protein
MKTPNIHNSRETWLRAAGAELRSYFSDCGLKIPENIRYAIAFPSTGRKGKRVGECWHSSASDDSSYEIFLRADLSDPVIVLGALVKELVHTTLPDDAGHGKQFKDAATKVGLQGPMREAKPGVLLQERLHALAVTLGPLPHASLNFTAKDPLTAIAVAVNRPKKQRGRMLKAHCDAEGCGFLVRVAALQARKIGFPHCPVHGAMTVDFPSEEEETETGGTEEAKTADGGSESV